MKITSPDEVPQKNTELNSNAKNTSKLKTSNLSCENINALFKINE